MLKHWFMANIKLIKKYFILGSNGGGGKGGKGGGKGRGGKLT